MPSDAIEIALPSDQNYFPGLMVTVYSMAKNASSNAVLVFNILDGGIVDDSFALLQKTVAKVHPKSSFRRFKIDEQDFSTFPDWKGNKMTYVRYLLPRLLKESQFVIYGDSDCLWLADIESLWRRRDENIILHGVYDSLGEKSERTWFESRGLSFSEDRYFCNGLLLMNLDLFRKEGIIEKCTDFIKNHPDVQYADQSAFNHVIGSRVMMLPTLFNFFTREISSNVVHAPVVLHYANDLPWRDPFLPTIFLPNYKYLWFQYYAEAMDVRTDVICRRHGYTHRRFIHALLTYLLPRDFARHILLGFLLVFHMRHTFEALRHYAGKCGEIKC